VCGDAPAAQALAARLQTAGVAFVRAASLDGRIAEADDAVLFVTDGRSATQRAAEGGIANTVLIDLALDYNRATRVALTHAGQCSESAFAAACAVLQACDIQVSRLADVPGLAVMRTVAMLANEAADAVYQGVCTARAADDAMRLGVNYPQGPLAWADQVGLAHIHAVLTYLNASYGEDRYRISPLIQRQVYQGKNIHG
jgi:3-hydroxybutyryl-CoA dehydrogenase